MVQLEGIFIICLWTAIATLITLKLISFVTELRVSLEDEEVGLDMSEHNEQGYSL
jgi:Amt family ammonium transporter